MKLGKNTVQYNEDEETPLIIKFCSKQQGSTVTATAIKTDGKEMT